VIGRPWKLLVVLALLGVGGGVALGGEMLGPTRLIDLVRDPQAPLSQVVLVWRLPRVLAAFCVGACLAMSGVLFQGAFRNPLAEPYLLGSAGGAAIGAAISLLVPLPLPVLVSLPLLTFTGAWGATWIVIVVARGAGIADGAGLLLAGVAVAAMLAAARGLLLLLLSDETVNLQAVLSWMLGGIQTPFWHELPVLALATLAAFMLCRILTRGLDVLGLGDDMAAALGLGVERFMHRAVLMGALVTAVAVAWGGLIGFVGLIVPHVLRWWLGPLHGRLLPAAAIAGGALLALLDGVARAIMPPAEVPIGLLTALIGGPFFLVILARGRRA
jgi:iron complex transport system permease protein